MRAEAVLKITWKEYQEALDRSYERGFRDGFNKGSEAGLELVVDAMNRIAPQPIIIQGTSSGNALEARVAELEEAGTKRTAQNGASEEKQQDTGDPWESEPYAPTRPRPRNECTCPECMEPGLR